MEAMQAQTVDVIKRMKEITLVMQTPKQVLESRGGRGDFSRYRRLYMLDELQEHVELIDMANALIRHNKPGIAAFLLANGYATLRGALGSESLRFQSSSSEDGEVREAAYEDFLSLPKTGLERMLGISSMSPEDLDAAKKMQLVDSLWNICYNEPSSLREKGLVLPGEDALPPDVASKHFEPPLRAWAANRNEDTKPSNEKKQAPLLIGLGPPAQNSSSGGMAGEENRDTST
ncbi:hypothetical protein P3L10_026694 [Capsicum annuum]